MDRLWESGCKFDQVMPREMNPILSFLLTFILPIVVFVAVGELMSRVMMKRMGGGNDEREQTLNQLLTEMDGFEGSKGVVILAATNRPETLDPALLRPGRFDRRVPVELPDLQGREAILKVHAAKVKLAEDVDFNAIARAASGASGAELAKITIIPRTSGALGYTMQVEQEERNLMSREELENQIATLTGGRAAEELVFHSITTGASNDIEKVTKLARAMVTRYGMTEDFDMVALETVTNQYMGGDTSLACAPETSAKIDQMVVDTVKAQHQKALKLLADNEAKLHELSKFLCEKETITGEEFMSILERIN